MTPTLVRSGVTILGLATGLIVFSALAPVGRARAAGQTAGAADAAAAGEMSRGGESRIAGVRKRDFSLGKRERELIQRARAVAKLEKLIDERVVELESMRVRI